jgi:hypothetical protein
MGNKHEKARVFKGLTTIFAHACSEDAIVGVEDLKQMANGSVNFG